VQGKIEEAESMRAYLKIAGGLHKEISMLTGQSDKLLIISQDCEKIQFYN